jgi:hypothetical protein
MASTLSPRWLWPADVFRRIANSLFQHRSTKTVSAEFSRLGPAAYTGRLALDPSEGRDVALRYNTELLKAEAVDEGHAAVIDPLIDTMVHQWRCRSHDEHDLHRRDLGRYRAEASAAVDVHRLRLAFLLAQLGEMDANLAGVLERHIPDPGDPGIAP